jgi:putative GTP pyrophosphokinase
MSEAPSSDQPSAMTLSHALSIRAEFDRLIMEAQFAVDEVLTKVSILQREFLHLHRYNPIEHVGSRVKSPASIVEKMSRRHLEPSFAAMRSGITDIAGVRITCSFIADTYRILETLTSQDDIRVLAIKDYIAEPKLNGYKSLHAIIEIPVFLSTGPLPVTVEIQVRTIAMDFWASLEHKIHYKYDGDVPAGIASDLTEAAAAAEQLDLRMEQLHSEVHGQHADGPVDNGTIDDVLVRRFWALGRRPSDTCPDA